MGPIFGNEQVNLIGRHLPLGTRAELRPGQRVQECYEMAHCLGLIQNRNRSKDLNHLKPKGEIHHVPKVPSDIVVMDVFPRSQR
jgi:hypothetical protein